MNRLEVVEQIITCTGCELHRTCTAPVPLRGQPAPIAIVGEAPGETEDREGSPFIGPAGKLLNEMLAEARITEPVAYLNTVSCWPNGTPTWDQINACRHNRTTQLDYLDPTWVLVLGRVALAATRPDLALRRGRGRPFLADGRIHFATYHPAAALRNSQYEACMHNDLARFRDLLDVGAEHWQRLIPDSCSSCPADADWFEADSGLGWCPIHLPSNELAGYEARQAEIAAELDAARRNAIAARDAGVASVAANADPDWMTQAWDALIEWLRTHDEFFVDDFWAGTTLARPRESRALGPIVMRASRDGLMEKTGRFRSSVASNMSEKPVWRSLLR